MTDSLLPANRTPWEAAQSLTNAARRPLPWHLIGRLYDPWNCPPDALPYLANSLSVDLWFDDWPIEKKRLVVARAFQLHRLKGRVEGVRQHLPFVNASLRRAETPPGKTFLMPSHSDAERAAYLARFPELRVYPFVASAGSPYGLFTTAGYGRPKAFLDAVHCFNLAAWSRYTRTSYIYDQGELAETLTVRTIREGTVADEIRIPTKAAMRVFPATPVSKLYPGGEDSTPIIFTIDRSGPFASARAGRTTLAPRLQTITIDPERVAEVHPRRRGMLFPGGVRRRGRPIDCFLASAYLPPSIAWRFFYERWFLFDPARTPDYRRRSVHLGYCRLGVGKFTARYTVRVTDRLWPREAQNFVAGFLRQPDKSHLTRAVLAVRVASAARDLPLMDTQVSRPITANDRLRVGQARLGQQIEA